MKTIQVADPVRYPRMTTQELRDSFLAGDLYESGAIHLAYVDLDRAVVGLATPLGAPLPLPSPAELRASFFTERRELGVLNVGGAGSVQVGETEHALGNLDVLYIGSGNESIHFTSQSSTQPAIFYLLSYPAHANYPVTLVRRDHAQPTVLGSPATANHRTIYKYIHRNGARSSQLVMGVTHLTEGSVWNTMPPHTHMRRSEIYFYFNLAPEARVLHLMGPPSETRHMVIQNLESIISPGWSIHAGAGTQAYSFCWGMGGENQDYADMDPAPIETLR
jgi:4-deoxy-L-threo-5-hexosulose-uronate ketol-isomerase